MTDIVRSLDFGVRGRVDVVADGEALARQAAEQIIAVSQTADTEHRTALVALSGGSTPKRMGELLATPEYGDRVAWGHLAIFWGDERFVPLASSDSNAGEALRAFIDASPICPDDVHTWETEGVTPSESASNYEAELREVSGVDTGVPVFDLILLGMGDDGHTLSLFPGTAAIHNNTDIVLAHHVEKLNADRLTFSPLLANAARKVVFLVGGAGKADTLPRVLQGEEDVDTLPSQVIRPTNGELVWLVDEAAAANLR
ncbi:MAG: 6-phosphogluconolactonase [Thermomicrobiales bacterium]|nr:6-phosphogluconolactonase [Thermomicrobiales bacterium]MCO5217351.1 6-phosphogluconolactonase [Thermomicrobiales bacterium]MCO5226657.1 6-phosphogluconolactonase [Thermomicrobiales bacterium]